MRTDAITSARPFFFSLQYFPTKMPLLFAGYLYLSHFACYSVGRMGHVRGAVQM
jgi:hypothetical protein